MNFNVGTQSFDMKEVINRLHPPVIRVKACMPNKGVLLRGRILTETDGQVEEYDPGSEDAPRHVLIEDCDTDNENTAKVLVHGTVNSYALTVKGGTPPTSTTLRALNLNGIWEINEGGL